MSFIGLIQNYVFSKKTIIHRIREGSQNSEGLKMPHVLVFLAAGTFTPTAGATTAATTWSSTPSHTARQGSATSRRWQTGSTYEFPGEKRRNVYILRKKTYPHSFATALLIPCFLHCVHKAMLNIIP